VLFGFAQHLLVPILGGDVAPGQAQAAIDNNSPEVKASGPRGDLAFEWRGIEDHWCPRLHSLHIPWKSPPVACLGIGAAGRRRDPRQTASGIEGGWVGVTVQVDNHAACITTGSSRTRASNSESNTACRFARCASNLVALRQLVDDLHPETTRPGPSSSTRGWLVRHPVVGAVFSRSSNRYPLAGVGPRLSRPPRDPVRLRREPGAPQIGDGRATNSSGSTRADGSRSGTPTAAIRPRETPSDAFSASIRYSRWERSSRAAPHGSLIRCLAAVTSTIWR
jgi:hypothetical protein